MAAVKTAISLEEELLRKIDTVARELELPRSRVLATAAEEFLRRRENREIFAALDRTYASAEEGDDERERRQARHRRLVEGEW